MRKDAMRQGIRAVGTLAEHEEPVASPPGRMVLVTIGINEYVHWPPLKNAVNDADGVAHLLVDKMDFYSGPHLQLQDKAATKAKISKLIHESLPAEVEEEDSLVLFFSGHGHTQLVEEKNERQKRGYLIPVEARNDHPEDYISLEEFLRDLNMLKIRHILVILDACHSDP